MKLLLWKVEMKKAQSAIEFVILVGAVLFFFLAFLFALQLSSVDKNRENKNFVIKEIALTVQNEISLATESSDGYYREFEIPNNILGSEYDIDIIEDLVYLNTTDGKYAIAFPVANVTGEINVGVNSIRKNSGEVYLNS